MGGVDPVLALLMGSEASPDTQLTSKSQWKELTDSPVTQEPVVKTAPHSPDEGLGCGSG